jgi:hypothetical protein
MRLDEIAIAIRSKNAGPCLLTLDLLFPSLEVFEGVRERLPDLRRQVSQRYGRPVEQVRVFACEPARSIKITMPRQVLSGDIGDRDVYGAQQHAPLLDIEL